MKLRTSDPSMESLAVCCKANIKHDDLDRLHVLCGALVQNTL